MIKTKNLEIDEHGIFILKNGIRQEYIEFSSIGYARINKGFRNKNWIITLTIGLILFVVFNYWLLDIIANFNYNPQIYTSDIRVPWLLLFSLVFLVLMSLAIVISALKRTMILNIFNKNNHWRMDIEKEEFTDELFTYLKEYIDIDKT